MVRILELGCKRPGERSEIFWENIRGSKCKPKSYVIEMKTHYQVIT